MYSYIVYHRSRILNKRNSKQFDIKYLKILIPNLLVYRRNARPNLRNVRVQAASNAQGPVLGSYGDRKRLTFSASQFQTTLHQPCLLVTFCEISPTFTRFLLDESCLSVLCLSVFPALELVYSISFVTKFLCQSTIEFSSSAFFSLLNSSTSILVRRLL